jgi:hypothetical protein
VHGHRSAALLHEEGKYKEQVEICSCTMHQEVINRNKTGTHKT